MKNSCKYVLISLILFMIFGILSDKYKNLEHNNIFMSLFICFFLAYGFFGLLCILRIRAYNKENRENYEKKLNENRIARTLKINQILYDSKDFISDESYINKDNTAFIALDEKNRKFIFGGGSSNEKNIDHIIITANKIIGIELAQNGNELLSSSSTFGRAAVGGLFFGGAGAVVGAISAGNSKSIDKISLKIALDDIKIPYIEFNFLFSRINKDSKEYIETLKLAEKWYGIVNIILEREKKSNVK